MKKDEVNILFLGGAKRISLAEHFIKKGQEQNLKVNIYSYELDEFVPVAAVGKIIKGLRWNDTNLNNHLIDTIRHYDIHIVLPFVDPAIAVASKLANQLKDLFVPVSDEKICELMFDKVLANDWFIANGFDVPDNKLNKWPVIAKPRFGSASKGLLILNDQQAYDDFLQRNDATGYLVQQFIIAEEYTVDCYVDMAEKITSIVPRKRLEVTSGEATRSITEKDRQIIETARKILSTGNFKGPITIQFLKEQSSGNVYVMEINARLGGGVLTSIAAGADVVQYILNDFRGIRNEQFDSWTENLLMVRAFREFYFLCK